MPKRGLRIAAVLLGVSRVAAATGPAEVHADDVTLDAKGKSIEVTGHVRVDAYPFFLTSDRLRITRTSRGLELEGLSRLSVCECSAPPITVSASGGLVAPPGELILKNPRLELFKIPVFWLPYFWLRAPNRVGLLPPEVAYRGRDGMFLGEGIHIPGATLKESLDVRGGAYLDGGGAVDARLDSLRAHSRVRVDHLQNTGVLVDSRGTTKLSRDGMIAWDVDALRGQRAVDATTDLHVASLPYDRATANASWGDSAWTFSSGIVAISPRGSDARPLAGPVLEARWSAPFGVSDQASVSMSAGTLSAQAETYSFVRARSIVELTRTLGPLAWQLVSDLRTDSVQTATRATTLGLGRTRTGFALPFARSFGWEEKHWIEPSLAVEGIATKGATIWSGEAPESTWTAILGPGLRNLVAFGPTIQIESDIRVGPVVDATQTSVGARHRQTLQSRLLGLDVDGMVQGSAKHSHFARGRIGARAHSFVGATVAVESGASSRVTRAFLGQEDTLWAYQSRRGTSVGVDGQLEFARWLHLSGGADLDATTKLFLGERAGVELRDGCDCMAFRFSVSHRLARPGVDAWLTIELLKR